MIQFKPKPLKAINYFIALSLDGSVIIIIIIIQFFIYLLAELNSRRPITESARKTNTTNRTKHT
jgi:hypothetical protein